MDFSLSVDSVVEGALPFPFVFGRAGTTCFLGLSSVSEEIALLFSFERGVGLVTFLFPTLGLRATSGPLDDSAFCSEREGSSVIL
jgi:hypothetical protein